MKKIVFLISAVVFFYTIALSHAAIVCDLDITSTGWNQSNEATWISGVYSIPITCYDDTTNNPPPAGYIAQFQITFNSGQRTGECTYEFMENTVGGEPIQILSSPTDADGTASINMALIHETNVDGEATGNYAHICPFDDIIFTGGIEPLSYPTRSFLNDISAPAATFNYACGQLGCCQVTVTVSCTFRPKTFTFCVNTTQTLCSVLNYNKCPFIKSVSVFDSNKNCNYSAKQCEDNTLIALSSFNAKASSGRVKLEWVTESEIDNAGFNIYRAEEEDGDYIQLNDALIAAKGSAAKGAKYVFTDNIAKNRKTYFYKLEDIDTYGVSTFHGPVSATPRLINLFQ